MTESNRENPNNNRVYFQSVITGSFVGMAAYWFPALFEGASIAFLLIPVLVIVTGLIAMVFVAFGLLLLGPPLFRLLQRLEDAWWILILATVIGGILGKLSFDALSGDFWPSGELFVLGWPSPGLWCGAATGAAFCYFHKKNGA